MTQMNELSRKSIKEHVYECLRREIGNGYFKPGDEINLCATAKRLGVSLTPIRDAITMLETGDFVDVKPRRGAVVKSLSVKMIREYYDIIGGLESVTVLCAGDSITPEMVKDMHDLVDKMETALEQRNVEAIRAANRDFHDIYIKGCDNRLLERIIYNLKIRIQDFSQSDSMFVEWERYTLNEHRILADLFDRGEIHEAADFIRCYHWSYERQKQFIHKQFRLE